jgi:hypothetical protein
VTSPDGGGSTEADGPAEGSRRNAAPGPAGPPPDHDPVRSTPPADPWLAEAPTSVVGDDASLQGSSSAGDVPPADTARFAAAAPWHGEPPYDQPHRRRDRRPMRWVLAILAACALFIAGMLAIDPFGPGDDDGGPLGSGPSTGATAASTRTGKAQEQQVGGVPSADVTTGPASTGPPESSAGAAVPGTVADAPEVVYEVTASGSRNTGSVSYTDQDGDIIRRSGIPLPWRITFPVGAQRQSLVLSAQRKGGGDAGPVTCTITVGGKLLASTTAHGRYAAPLCSGSG